MDHGNLNQGLAIAGQHLIISDLRLSSNMDELAFLLQVFRDTRLDIEID